MNKFSMPQMYFRQGQLLKDFSVERKVDDLNSRGREVNAWVADIPPLVVQGMMLQLTPKELEIFKQLNHPIDVKVMVQGQPICVTGDRFIYVDKQQVYYIHKIVPVSELGLWTVYYCENHGSVTEEMSD